VSVPIIPAFVDTWQAKLSKPVAGAGARAASSSQPPAKTFRLICVAVVF
jgi:hypothetical protein